MNDTIYNFEEIILFLDILWYLSGIFLDCSNSE